MCSQRAGKSQVGAYRSPFGANWGQTANFATAAKFESVPTLRAILEGGEFFTEIYTAMHRIGKPR